MRVVLSWLNEMAPFGDDVEALAAELSMLGLAVESVDRVGEGVPGVIVARVLETRPHPKADRVHLVDVDTGDGRAQQIVCGAFNMTAGDLVPLATPGTAMPDGRAIEAASIRGQSSNGMLCSARELGLGDDASGILILPPSVTPGTPVFSALGVTSDVVFDLDVTRNRPEAWCHLGVARDLAAHHGVPFTPPPSPPAAADGPERPVTVDIVDPADCGRFTATVLTGVRVGPSPAWMAERLTRAGMRPISNVVDVSNYVMLELGQPSHPYDYAKLPGAGFIVRRARDGERVTTLDDVERAMTADELLICDATDAPVGIAGVMGGTSSEIDDATTEVLLEMAWFRPGSVAATVARLGLRSEASARFERGVDPYIADAAIARFVELLRLSSPDVAVAPGAVNARGRLPENAVPTVRVARVEAILGVAISAAEIHRLLEPIGFAVSADDATLTITVPSWRPDCTTEIDVIEEIARQYGYDRLGRTVPTSAHAGSLTPRQRARRLARDVLIGAGLDEAMPNPFLAPGDVERVGLDPAEALVLTNPLASEESVLRTSLRPGLMKAVAYNESHRISGAALFEIGHVWRRAEPGSELPDEPEMIGVALAGREAPAAVAVWDELAAALGVDGASLEAADAPGLHPTRTARICSGEVLLGLVGEIDPEVRDAYGVSERVAWLEVDFGVLLDVRAGRRPFARVSKYPSSDVDLAFVVADDVAAARVDGAVRSAVPDLLADLTLFDVYRGDGVPPGHRSLAYRLRLQAADRTLNDADVAAARDTAIHAAAGVGARLRS